VCAAEALVRWRHPAGTIVEPGKFIGIAEDTGLIVPLGEWILRRACTDALEWPEDIRVSVNLSVVQFASGNICDLVETVLRETQLPANRLELEVTESLFLHCNESALGFLHGLKALGVSIALDDFGTGYSSLNYLTKFPFDRIKIDKSFIVDLTNRSECSAIVAAIIGVAGSIGMTTTAEGVETPEQYELLRLAGCDEMQGFLFGRPRPVSDLLASFQNSTAPRQFA
jgi:EAL domain-containing protein (putative c-di-GMP-specific phosphodiesterase class I)